MFCYLFVKWFDVSVDIQLCVFSIELWTILC